MQNVFCSWSGGKDCCLACYMAQNSGLKVSYLANMITENSERSWSHGQRPELLQIQAEALGIPLYQQRSNRADYTASFQKMILEMKKDGVSGGVFGDIDFNAHREWIEKVCRETGINPHLPLWLRSQDELMEEFIKLGFEAVVVAVKTDVLDAGVLGQRLDGKFVKHLREIGKDKDVTICGEAGEYHTFVVDGPIFRQRIDIRDSQVVNEDGRAIMKILKTDLQAK